MPRDELRQPLRKRSLRERLWSRRPGALMTASVLLLAAFGGGAAWLVRQDHPFAGEPVVVAAIPAVQELTTATATPLPAADDADDASPEDVMDANAGLADSEPALPKRAYQQEASIVVARHRAMKPAPIDAVTETTPQGPLPRVSGRGKKPFDVYSQVTPLAVTTSARPKIAILLGGMGLNAKLTAKAIKDLPGDVSFGFAPYGENLQDQVNRARAKGHEVMLQVPMEPVGYPAVNPGPKTLLADATSKDNIDSLQWHMSRFSGYAGVMNSWAPACW